MPNNITVKITADVVDLRTKMALAKADLSATNKELGTLAKTASAGGLTAGLQSDLTKAAEKSVAAEAKVKGLQGALKGLAKDAEHGGHEKTGWLRYVREVFDEVSSGRTRYLPSTLAALGQQYLGLSASALGAVAAVAAVSAGLGYMAVKAIEAQNALSRLKIGADFAGNLELSADALKRVSDEIGSNGDAIVGAFSRIGNMTTPELEALSIATSEYAQVTGEKAAKAVKAISTAMSDASLNLTKLRAIFPGVTDAEARNYLAVQKTGDAHKTAAALVELMQERLAATRKDLIEYAAGWTSISNDIRLAAAEIQNWTYLPISSALEEGIHLWHEYGKQVEGAAHWLHTLGGLLPGEDQVSAVHKVLAKIAAAYIDHQNATAKHAAALTGSTPDNRGALDSALATANKLDTVAAKVKTLNAEIKQLEAQRKNPLATPANVAHINAAIADAEAQKKALQDRGSVGGLAGHSRAQEEARKQIQAIAQAGQKITEILRSDASADEQISNEKFQQKKQLLQREVEAGRITNAQMIDAEIALTQKMFEQDLTRLQAEMQANKGRVVDENSVANQIREVETKLNADLATLRAQRELAEQKDTQRRLQNWEKTHKGLLNSERQLIDGVLSGNQNMETLLERMAFSRFENLVVGEAKTMTERLLIQQTGADEDKAISLKSALEQIANDAAKAASATYAAVAAIPVVGPLLAPEAAAAAAVAVFGFEAMTSAAGGQWSVPYDGQLTELHKEEMVMPAYLANPMRRAVVNMASGGTAGGNAGSVVHHHHYQVNISAHDARSVQAWANENAKTLAGALNRHARDFPGSFSAFPKRSPA